MFQYILPQILTSVKQRRPTVLMAAATLLAPMLVFAMLLMSWDLMANSVTVSLSITKHFKPLLG